MTHSIAIVGMACRYPDARTPGELWENVLAQRRSFRRMPKERLSMADYWSADRSTPDATYSQWAALIDGYEFDRGKFRVAGSTYRQADPAHWLALDIASQALADAGFPDAAGLAGDNVGVLVGNSLTGEFSRANLMRLRWPYVRRTVEAALAGQGWDSARRGDFLAELERQYKSPFPAVGDETLAGGLSNTIAGRICNYFNFKGGGYTLDGACASSLLAVANACSALAAGDLDFALAGGVDLSLDPFELVGFAKVGALASEQMRVYDVRSAGFWPGEGCGFVALMRSEDAQRHRLRCYATLRGWGISSDGCGGITRPEVEGQSLALARAYRRAGLAVDAVAYFEGHGTGTAVGDATELKTLSQARRGAPAAVGSIKANIGHTKAAAGVAGLIKATLAVHRQLLPPTTGCEQPHAELTRQGASLRVLRHSEPFPHGHPPRAGVSAMGFGGINVHVVLEGAASRPRRGLEPRERALGASAQDAELFLLAAPTPDALRLQVRQLLAVAGQLSLAQLTDLSAHLAEQVRRDSFRAAVVASRPDELEAGLGTLDRWLGEGVSGRLEPRSGVMLGSGTGRPRIGLLFPGQGSPGNLDGGLWARRFEAVRELYQRADLPRRGDSVATEVAQPAIVTASVAGLLLLDQLGLTAELAIGHSLGELVAYHWGGAWDEASLLHAAEARGRAVAEHGTAGGAMASLAAPLEVVEPLLEGRPVVVSGINSPKQTVVSGTVADIEKLVALAKERGIGAVRLAVSHAFHSPLVAAAAPVLAQALDGQNWRPLRRTVISTITGRRLPADADLRQLLVDQMTAAVRFLPALRSVADDVDLWIEVGPGSVQRGIAAATVDTPVVSLDAGAQSVRPLLESVAAAYALGAAVDVLALVRDRVTRPFSLDWQGKFFVNPCELAPEPPADAADRTSHRVATPAPAARHVEAPPADEPAAADQAPLEVVRRLVAKQAELPLTSVGDGDRLLSDLHLSSITVGHVVAESARALGLAPPTDPTAFASATVGEVAAALAELVEKGGTPAAPAKEALPPGVAPWVRPLVVELVERPLSKRPAQTGASQWQVFAPSDCPLAERLRAELATLAGHGAVVCLPVESDVPAVELLLQAARAVQALPKHAHFVVVEQGAGAAGWARTLHLEMPDAVVNVVDLPLAHPRAAEWVAAEIGGAAGYCEAHYDLAGVRRVPLARALDLPPGDGPLPLGRGDVLLVTGGGKGIAAECALELARRTGTAVALLGRSQPGQDAELTANLARFEAAGARCLYVAADVTRAEQVSAAVQRVEAELGPVTAVLHAAGTNVPQLLAALEPAAVARTLAPKTAGLNNVLSAVSPQRLRLLLTFGSIIARTGLPGEADYALANQWQTLLTERWQAAHPHCRCLAIEWSVWSGVGMGQRLGRIEALRRDGITAITPEQGVQVLCRLLAAELPATAVVVTGRFGQPATLKFSEPPLPLWRFLEHPKVYVPGVELVVDSELSTDSDPYLRDHAFQGTPLLPAVVGLEAMAQAARALLVTGQTPVFEDVQLLRPVVVPESARATIRVAALVREPGVVEVVLRSQESGFQADHFRALCRFGEEVDLSSEPGREIPAEALPLSPERDLYGGILFHSGRFRRLAGYRELRATECVAEIRPDADGPWFHGYLSQQLVLGDPGARDAVIHAIQACIPQGTILPTGVERIVPCAALGEGPCFVDARERSQRGQDFVYDLTVVDSRGRAIERWDGLQLRRVSSTAPDASWPEPLLGPYLERRLGELMPGVKASIVVDRQVAAGPARSSDELIRRAVGQPLAVLRRPDGKPEIAAPLAVSVAHAEPLAIVVAGDGTLACDAEPVAPRGEEAWRDLLGQHRSALAQLLERELGEDPHTAATRVWTAIECLKKAGANLDGPLVFREKTADDWALLVSGRLTIATWAGPAQSLARKVVWGLLVGDEAAQS